MTTKKKTTAPKGVKTTTLTEPAAVETRAKAPRATKKAAAAKVEAKAEPVAVVTTVTMVAEAPAAEAKPVLTIGMFQKALYQAGHYGGHWDGDYGPMTKHAVRSFQHANGLPVDGEPTPATLVALGLN